MANCKKQCYTISASTAKRLDAICQRAYDTLDGKQKPLIRLRKEGKRDDKGRKVVVCGKNIVRKISAYEEHHHINTEW